MRGTFYSLRSAHTVYLYVSCRFQNKQLLFHCTALANRLVLIRETECVLCGTIYILRSAHTMYVCMCFVWV
jgi:hypothetical protein